MPARLLIQSQQGIALFQLRGSGFVPRRILLNAGVVGVDGVFVILLAVIAFADVELGVRGAVGVLVILQIILKGLNRQIILSAVVIAQTLVVKGIRIGDGRSATARGWGSGRVRVWDDCAGSVCRTFCICAI